MVKKNISRIPNSKQNIRFEGNYNRTQNEEKLKYNIEKILKNNDIEQASGIIVQYISDFLRQKTAKARRLCAAVLGLCVILFLALCVSWILEYPLNQSTLRYWVVIVGAGGDIFLAIIQVYLNSPKKIYYRKKDQGKFEAIFHLLGEIITNFSKMTVIHLLMCIASIFILGGIFAHFNFEHRIVEFCRKGSNAFVCYDSASDLGTLAEEETIKEGMLLLGNVDAVQIEQLSENTKITIWEAEMEMLLASDDWNLVFFHGEYNIEGLENQEQIDHIVFSMVSELVSHDHENVFDKPPAQGGAPQSVRNEISNASDTEKYAESFVEISRILDLREMVNEIYPKKSLTQLVANGYEKLAYLLYINKGNQTSTIYYYGQSIINNLRCLEFSENTDRTIKERLIVIARLYKNIAYTCPNSEEAGISLILAESFEHAANQY